MQHFDSQICTTKPAPLALGAALARALAPGLAIYLHGDLGAGKTALTRALLHAAGHPGHVKSPTYTLAEPYTVSAGRAAGRRRSISTCTGWPARKNSSTPVFAKISTHDNICIVEWPEKAEPVLPPPDINVFLTRCMARAVR